MTVSPLDKKTFMSKIGGLKVDTGAENAKGKKSFSEELIETQQEAIKTKAAAQIMGIDLHGSPSPPAKSQEEPLASSIVTAAMTSMKDTNKEIREEANKLHERYETAVKERDIARASALENQIGALVESQNKLEEALKDMKAGASRGAISEFKEARQLLSEVQELGGKEAHGPPAPAISPELQITLMKMQHDHELAMKNLELQIANANRDYNLKVAEFQDNKDLRWKEYEDKKSGRGGMMSGFQDLVSSLAGNITTEREVEEGITHKGSSRPASLPRNQPRTNTTSPRLSSPASPAVQ